MADGRELGVNDVIVSRVHDEEPLHRPPSVSRFDSCGGAPPPESLSAWANDLSASDDRRLTVLHIGTLNKQLGTNLGYSPIETVIDNVHRGLRAGGHRSIVACSADSRFAGERHATVSRSLGDYVRDDTVEGRDRVRRHLSSAFDRAAMGDVDVIHMHEHVGHAYEAYEAGYSPVAPVVMTLHVKAAESGLRQARHACSNALAKQSVYFVAISDDQSADYAPIVAPWATVHHGIDVNDFPIKTTPSSDGYLLMIGRVTRDKGQHRAIELAKRTGSTLVIAGCVQNKPDDAAFFDSIKGSIDAFVDVNRHPAGPDYFERVIQPVLASGHRIIYIGEVDADQKKHWYRHARATLFPIQWREPFGLVLIDSMACGTPVLAFNRGAVAEIVATGRTGFVVNTMDEMVAAEAQLTRLDPRVCRRHVATFFSTSRMASGYTKVYRDVIREHERHGQAVPDRSLVEMRA